MSSAEVDLEIGCTHCFPVLLKIKSLQSSTSKSLTIMSKHVQAFNVAELYTDRSAIYMLTFVLMHFNGKIPFRKYALTKCL